MSFVSHDGPLGFITPVLRKGVHSIDISQRQLFYLTAKVHSI